ncbi:MAG TPA: C4-dicarboxylate ABC transporter, partial [Bacillota bacterium]|nr:C4-dicarboxylate ABC transporter [Bacillota bacterium]
MIPDIWIILAVMVIAFILAKIKLSVEISMMAAAIAGLLAGAFFSTPPIDRMTYHIVNGTLTYLDIILVFITATFLMEVISASGGSNWVVASIVNRFGRKPALTMTLLTLVLLIPGALSGVGTTALVMLGGPVAAVLGTFGLPKRRVAGILFIMASLGAVAPPVNLWAMISCAGASIPYVG